MRINDFGWFNELEKNTYMSECFFFREFLFCSNETFESILLMGQ